MSFHERVPSSRGVLHETSCGNRSGIEERDRRHHSDPRDRTLSCEQPVKSTRFTAQRLQGHTLRRHGDGAREDYFDGGSFVSRHVAGCSSEEADGTAGSRRGMADRRIEWNGGAGGREAEAEAEAQGQAWAQGGKRRRRKWKRRGKRKRERRGERAWSGGAEA